KLAKVPRGSAVMETSSTKEEGEALTGKKISLKRALSNVDTSLMTLPQMKTMIEALKQLKAERDQTRGRKTTLRRLKKDPVIPIPSTSTQSEPLLPAQSISLLEWSMAQPSVEEIEKELRENGLDLRSASKEHIRRSLIRLRQLKKSVYEQLRPAGDRKKMPQTTAKIGQETEFDASAPHSRKKITTKGESEENESMTDIKERSASAEKTESTSSDDVGEKLYVVKLLKKASTSGKEATKSVKRARSGYESDQSEGSIEDERRYREQKRAAREGRKEMKKNEDEEREEPNDDRYERPRSAKRRRDEEEETVTMDGKVLLKKRKKQVDPTGFSLLPTRSIYRYRDRFGLDKEEGDSRAALVFGAQMHFNKLEGSASAIPYFVHAVKAGGNYLDERDARQLRLSLERQRAQADQLAAAGLQPPPAPARGTRYRVAANQQKQMMIEAENQPVGDNDDDDS
ncbi:hypothetical protein PENTCL1PPCAC_12139, partial [Pristionchus entomophagus]